MARTTEADIRAVVETDADIGVSIFIEAANILTDKIKTCAEDRERDLTSDQLKHVETYLAAHLYALRDQQYRTKRTERAQAGYGGDWGKALDFTRFGQMAKILDTSGCLEAFSSGVVAQLIWLGKPPSSQTDYVDRD